MSSSARYEGIREGVKWAVAWLHERAKEMNDPHAQQILNGAAFNMGSDAREFKRALIGIEAGETPYEYAQRILRNRTAAMWIRGASAAEIAAMAGSPTPQEGE